MKRPGPPTWPAVKEAAKGIQFAAPGGMVTIHNENQHVSKTVRIGTVRDDGQIDEIWNSGSPVVPDPYLDSYEWAAGLRELCPVASTVRIRICRIEGFAGLGVLRRRMAPILSIPKS